MKKKITVTVLLFCFALAFVPAEEGGIGLTAGVDVGFGDITDDMVISVIPNMEYARIFGGIALRAYVEYNLAFADPKAAQDLYGELEGFYSLKLGEPSLLTFGVYTEHGFHLAPDWGNDVRVYKMIIEPRVMYTQTFGFGSLYGRVGVPLGIFHQEVLKDNDEFGLGMNFRLGWKSNFGLETHVTANMDLKPGREYTGTDLLVSYEPESIGLYAEVKATADKSFDLFTVTPKIEFWLNDMFGIWAQAELGGLGNELSVVPTVGVKASF